MTEILNETIYDSKMTIIFRLVSNHYFFIDTWCNISLFDNSKFYFVIFNVISRYI